MSSTTPHEAPLPSGEWGFLAPLGSALDWRLVLCFDALQRAGLLASLPDDLASIASACGVEPDACRRLVQVLVHGGVLCLDGDRLDRGPAFPTDAARRQVIQHANAIRQWGAQLDDRLHGITSSEPGGRFDREGWLRSMAVPAVRDRDEIAERVLRAFPAAASVLELGGGHGEYGRAFARRGLRVTMVDTPEIIGLVRELGWLRDDAIELVGGDFHESLPVGPFDSVLCFGINHTFGPAKNAALFGRIAEVIAPGGVVAISTSLAGSGERAAVFSVHMLANRSGGDTHAEELYRRWLDDAGFELESIETVGPEGRALLLARRLAQPAAPVRTDRT